MRTEGQASERGDTRLVGFGDAHDGTLDTMATTAMAIAIDGMFGIHVMSFNCIPRSSSPVSTILLIPF